MNDEKALNEVIKDVTNMKVIDVSDIRPELLEAVKSSLDIIFLMTDLISLMGVDDLHKELSLLKVKYGDTDV